MSQRELGTIPSEFEAKVSSLKDSKSSLSYNNSVNCSLLYLDVQVRKCSLGRQQRGTLPTTLAHTLTNVSTGTKWRDDGPMQDARCAIFILYIMHHFIDEAMQGNMSDCVILLHLGCKQLQSLCHPLPLQPSDIIWR